VGAPGSQGLIGLTGEVGAPGLQGLIGLKGEAGAPGLQGLIGLKGEAGAAGSPGSIGLTGEAGAPGSQGLIGLKGEAGAPGSQGLIGLKGEAGAPGSQGLIGLKGEAGAAGSPGSIGLTGERGQAGAPGSPGETGPAGPAGPPGPAGFAAFAEYYALMPPDNAATVAPATPVQFPQNGPTSGALTRRGGSSPSEFVLPEIGTYRVSFSVSVDEAGQLGIAVDSGSGMTGLPYTVYGRATGTSEISGEALVTTTAPSSVLEVRNPAGNTTALTITPIAGGTHPAVASLVIQRIG
jgi:hypothetical protein